MRQSLLQYLACPTCASNLVLTADVAIEDRVQTGTLACSACSETYPIVNSIPRFVPRHNYAASFGLEWNAHSRTQYDAHTGLRLSEERLFAETRWPRDMRGEVVLEVGSGSGRFTEHLAATGCTVISVDFSDAVDANYVSNGHRDNVLIVQGDAYRLPCRSAFADRVLCIGVLQHTPDPERTFRSLLPHLRPGGALCIDVYKKTVGRTYLNTKYWIRPVTSRMDPGRLYHLVCRYVDLMWPLATVVRRIPVIGRTLNWRLLIADYTHDGLSGAAAKEWAYLDTFDMLSPRYDKPQTISTVRRWFESAGLEDVSVEYGYNGIQARGRRSVVNARAT